MNAPLAVLRFYEWHSLDPTTPVSNKLKMDRFLNKLYFGNLAFTLLDKGKGCLGSESRYFCSGCMAIDVDPEYADAYAKRAQTSSLDFMVLEETGFTCKGRTVKYSEDYALVDAAIADRLSSNIDWILLTFATKLKHKAIKTSNKHWLDAAFFMLKEATNNASSRTLKELCKKTEKTLNKIKNKLEAE